MVAESEGNLEGIVEERNREFSCGSRPTAKMEAVVCPLTSFLSFPSGREAHWNPGGTVP